MVKGCIFDFNGTIFWDTKFHDRAWMDFSHKYDLGITQKYLREHLHGKVNREIFRIVLGSEISEEKAFVMSEEKEAMYRQIVSDLPEGPELAPGVATLFDSLKSKEVPMAIATSSTKSNVDFYKEIFDLNRWFRDDLIIYDNGSFEGKPAPDIFLLAAQRLHISPEDCLVVEDSVTGLQSAKAAGIGKIYLITTGNHLAWDQSDPEIEIIKDFKDFHPNLS